MCLVSEINYKARLMSLPRCLHPGHADCGQKKRLLNPPKDRGRGDRVGSKAGPWNLASDGSVVCLCVCICVCVCVCTPIWMCAHLCVRAGMCGYVAWMLMGFRTCLQAGDGASQMF